jgi:hypothetical protein
MYNKIIEQIKKIKPNLKLNSILTYIVSLKKISKELDNPDFLLDTKKVLKIIDNDKYLTTKKNRLTAIVVYLKSFEDKQYLEVIDKYSKEMERLSQEYQSQQKEQKLSSKQKQNWIGMDDFDDVIEKVYDEIEAENITKKKELNNRDYALLQSYILLRFYRQYPLRNDLADVKIIRSKKQDVGTENYLLLRPSSCYLILNVYKTSKIYGKRSYKLDINLHRLVKLLVFFNKSDYLFTRYNRKDPLTSNDLTKLLQRIFMKYTGKSIGSSLLRHIQISHDRQNDPTLKEIDEANKKVENKYLHSADMNQEYRKVEK